MDERFIKCHPSEASATQEWDIHHTYEKNSDTSSPVSLLGGQNTAREDGIDSPGQRNEWVTRLGKDGVLMERSNKVQERGRQRGGSEVEEKGGQEKTERSLEKC